MDNYQQNNVEYISTLGDITYNELPNWMRITLRECYNDFSKFCKFFFPGQFDVDFDQPHLDIISGLESTSNKVVINASRGIGKTTLVRAFICRELLFRERRFVVYVSKSETHAVEQTENIKEALTSSEKVNMFFGDVRSSYISDSNAKKNKWSTKGYVANDFSFILPRGAKQQVRGLNWVKGDLSLRPDLWIYDDLEDDEEIDNENLRKKLRGWFFGSAIKAVPQHHKDWRVVYIDTLKHEDALIDKVMNEHDWYSVRCPYAKGVGFDEDGLEKFITLAPRFKTQSDLDDDIRGHRNRKDMDIFAREVLGKPSAKEDASFSEDMFQYYNENDPDIISLFNSKSDMISTVVIVDPAKTAKTHNAETGFAVWTIDQFLNRLFLRKCIGLHLHPDQIYRTAINLCDQYLADTLAYEITGLEEFIDQPIKENIMNAYSYIDNVGIKDRDQLYVGPDLIQLRPRRMADSDEGHKVLRGKAARVSWGLMNYYRGKAIYHNDIGIGGEDSYEEQLLAFPRPKRWDKIEAAAYISQVMELKEIYFMRDSYIDDVLRNDRRKMANNLDDYYSIETSKGMRELPNNWRVV